MYSGGQYSLQEVWQALKREFGVKLSKSHVEKLLKNPFYTGTFYWDGKLYTGTQTPLISKFIFDQVQAVFRGHNQPKYKKHEFAFAGLLRCAYDDCTVTAELKKNRYTYYRCTGYRGKCDLPYFREEKLGDQLGQILKDIHIPDDILQQLEQVLLTDNERVEACTKADRNRLENMLFLVRSRLDQAYLDKLDGKISEAFWESKSAEWNEDQRRIQAELEELQLRGENRVQNGLRILELANKAYFLYLRQPPTEKAKLLRIVLSNCKVDAVSVYPTYRNPFDLIFNRVKTKEWLPGLDSN